MSYVFDPCGTGRPGPVGDATIVLVGCGGTGAFLAEALCRLLIGRRGSLHLVDPDLIEPRNALRQAYEPAEAGRFKAEVLARRLARRFRRVVGYSVAHYDADLHAHVFGPAGGGLRLLVGAVDNAPARRAIAATLEARGWDPGRSGGSAGLWMDLGNYAEYGCQADAAPATGRGASPLQCGSGDAVNTVVTLVPVRCGGRSGRAAGRRARRARRPPRGGSTGGRSATTPVGRSGSRS